MSESTSLSVRPSACPGLLRIVASRDGGICRIKLPCGQLDARAARAIAEAAERHADGVLEATNRANLQIRGVHAGAERSLSADLLAAGLGPRELAADDVRNLLVSPAIGLDIATRFDAGPLARQLLDLLERTPRFHGLSPKFGVQLDGGESLAMLEHPNDIWLSAMSADEAPQLAFGVAGCPPRHARDCPPLAAVPAAQAPLLVETLLHLFLDLAGDGQTRMRHLREMLGDETLLERLRQRLPFPLCQGTAVDNWRRPATPAFAHLGIRPQRQPGRALVGAGFVLGRLDSATLLGLADLAERFSGGQLRLTPWQSLILPDVAQIDAAVVLGALGNLGLLIDAARPLSRIVACSGSSGCARGLADTKADALRLADRLRLAPPAGVHLCGCRRSCAAAHVAPYTLLAVADGRYDLFRRTDGLAGFGQPLARNLSLDAAGELLAVAGAIPDA
ncbi:precorrin-3B synthase [Pseudomonas sp. ZM23]|uniref:Precorrin-3B synthase n=1 Tax=Pseudomonas triclosanedens TaxID=2961893 RepID=A0ABY7A2L3_9PSED|nr:precorrin-3B synthase [Pseudomonas triclosanedens]MCP8464149.1 precorrin-3B synthase [Pseudomonas triclosanedens]MCP8469233.1 precorrin-3B synthase [Pseudomonas triclosanedens]MCP8475955.1 precorrin-3B synthase [Pseudomonas triclosanedens]WAI50349.1 precorrin-3B synthase [Pseudomonas triclosanedens]